MEKEIKSGWLCPLYKKKISEGLCLDINYERLEYFKGDTVKNMMKQLHKNKSEIDCICEKCSNMPLGDVSSVKSRDK